MNVSVTGILVGGHVFVYDVCKDDLWLVKGKPEFSQFHPMENQQCEELAAKSNRPNTSNQNNGNETKSSKNDQYDWNPTFSQRSRKVISFSFLSKLQYIKYETSNFEPIILSLFTT